MFELYKNSLPTKYAGKKWISLRVGGILFFNKAVYQNYVYPKRAKDEKVYCRLFYEKEKNQIGIKIGVDRSLEGATCIDYREIKITDFLNHFNIGVIRTQRYVPFEENELLVIGLNSPQ